MQKNIFNRCFLISLIVCSANILTANDASSQKMMWAHLVGWGFEQVEGYDCIWKSHDARSKPFTDRSLLGKHVQSNAGMYAGCRKQVRCALEYGFDGFCVDVFSGFTGNMGRFYSAAEGTDFKIALCVDGSFSREGLVAELESFINTYGSHPNNCYVDGKMVIFIYSTQNSVEDWAAVIAELENKGCYAYYLARVIPESHARGNIDTIEKYLQVFDGFYDFGCNGFTKAEQLQRYRDVTDAIARVNPDAVFCPGITPGYLANFIGYYRPFLNSGTIASNWETAIESGADWVCITTWNDYIEHTHFEPSVINGDTLCRINLEYARKWRHEAPPARPAQPIFSYHEGYVTGSDFTIDAFTGAYTQDSTEITLRALDIDGNELWNFEPGYPDPNDISRVEWRIPGEEMLGWRKAFRLQASVHPCGSEPVWRELPHVAISYGRMDTLRPVRVAWDAVASIPLSISVSRHGDRLRADVQVNAWLGAGEMYIYRNGWPAGSAEVSFNGAPGHRFGIDIEAPEFSPADIYSVRFITSGETFAFSPPFVYCSQPLQPSSGHPVIITGNDFDENWPIWSKPVSRLAEPEHTICGFDAGDLFALTYDFSTEPVDEVFFQSLAWQLPAKAGANHWNWYTSSAENRPAHVETDGPDGTVVKVLRYDGVNDTVALPTRTMPYGPFTMEFVLRSRPNGEIQTLFSEANGAGYAALDGELRLISGRFSDNNAVTEPLVPGEWYHLAVVYDGAFILCFVNGTLAAQTEVPAISRGINSLPVVGSAGDHTKSFNGDLLAFHIQCGVLSAPEFVLLHKIHNIQ